LSRIEPANSARSNIPPVVSQFVRERQPSWEVRQDFVDVHMYPVGSYAGVVRLLVWPTTGENSESALVIVDQQRIRIRRSARHG
jgi:hypothetical protein